MGSALWIGTTGLNASSMQIDVIGNNLANSNTPGYKADNMYFSSLLTQSLATGGNSMSIGQGVRVSSVSTQFAAGAMQTTGNATDLAIDGDGFFCVKDGTGAEYFTRAGAFHTDKNNNLVDANGYFVQGYNPIANTVTGIGFGTPISGARPTANILSAGFNLDSDTITGGAFGLSQSIYDSLGGIHSAALAFTKTGTLGYWGLESRLDTTNYASITGGLGRVDGLVFSADGSLSGLYKVEDLTTTPGAGTYGFAAVTDPAADAATSTAMVDANDGVVITTTAAGNAQTIDDPTDVTAGKLFRVVNDAASTDPITVNGVALAAGATAIWQWDGDSWEAAANYAAGSVSLDSVHYGKLYQETTSPITLAFDGTTWSIAESGGYNAMAISFTPDAAPGALAGNGLIKLDVDGDSNTDVTLTTTNAAGINWTSGNTITFSNVNYETPTAKQNLAIRYNNLPNDPVYIGGTGADKNVLKWDMASDMIDTSGITSFASTSETRAFSVDGWTQGTLKSLSFDSDGRITGYFTNGQTKSLGQIQLARFTNPAGLKKVGNYFTMTELSGTPTRNYAGSGGTGDIRSNALEISNTDVTVEFINMMTAQRAYQANARVITADDQNFQQLISIKR